MLRCVSSISRQTQQPYASVCILNLLSVLLVRGHHLSDVRATDRRKMMQRSQMLLLPFRGRYPQGIPEIKKLAL